MPEEPPSAKERIDAMANDAIGRVDALRAENLTQELETGLEQVRQDLEAIVMDTHHPGGTEP
jgi:hypothetical protein